MQGQRYPPGSCACICACRRDHESWPVGESRRRDLNRSLAAGLQALPGPPSSLRSSPTGFFRRPPSHECRLRRLANAPLRGCTNSDSRAVGFVKRFVDIRVPRRRARDAARLSVGQASQTFPQDKRTPLYFANRTVGAVAMSSDRKASVAIPMADSRLSLSPSLTIKLNLIPSSRVLDVNPDAASYGTRTS